MSQSQAVEPMALRPREAARALSICTRTLWAITAPRGPVPCIRVGTGKRAIVLYRRADLDSWLAQESGRSANCSDVGAQLAPADRA